MLRQVLPIATITLFLAACSSSDFEQIADTPEVLAFGAVWSFGPTDVWVTAENGRILHYDGTTWSETKLDTSASMLDIWAFAPNDIWMVGGETLAHYDGTSFTLTDFTQVNPGIEGLAAIWGSSPEDIWVVGTQSTAAHWNGTSWQRFIAAGTENSDVWGSGPNDVYVVGLFDVAHWDGKSFTNIDTNLFSGAEGVWGFAASDVWLASGSDDIAHWDGTEWQVQELDFVAEASALWGSAPDDLWGVGTFGGILHYDGSKWREVDHQAIGSPFLRLFSDVHGSAPDDVWILGVELGEKGQKPLLYRHKL